MTSNIGARELERAPLGFGSRSPEEANVYAVGASRTILHRCSP